MTELRYCFDSEYEDGRLFRVETAESGIPVNVFGQPGSDDGLEPGDACFADICGLCSDLEVYEDEDAYYASGTQFASVSMVPLGVFSAEGGGRGDSPHIMFSGKVLDAEKDADAGPDDDNFYLRVSTLEMELHLFTRFEGDIKAGSTVHGTAWIFGKIRKERAPEEEASGEEASGGEASGEETSECPEGAVFKDADYELGAEGGEVYLTARGRRYGLSCQPQEPCTYISCDGKPYAVIHNGFDPAIAVRAFASGRTVSSASGKEYGAEEFCGTIAFAAENCPDADVSYVEGALAVRRLIAMGATCPEKAVDAAALGLRRISDRFSRSKKLKERVMYTGDGKVYVRIKE